MVRRASVAVVGGGVVGASIAYHLAKWGVLDVVVLDRGAGPGNGSTSRATGAQPGVGNAMIICDRLPGDRYR